MVSYQIKRKSKRKRGGGQKREEKHSLSSKTLNHAFFFLFNQLFNRHARLSFFSWLQGHRNLRFSRTVRFILSFLFNLFDEHACFSMLIFYETVWHCVCNCVSSNFDFFLFAKIECGLYFLDRFDMLMSKMIF